MSPRRTAASLAACFSLVCLAGVIALPATAHAQTIADFERKLLPHQAGALVSLDPRFWSSLSFLRAEEDKQRALKADIMFGMSGDEAGAKSLFKLATGISLSRGVFPSEISVVSRFLLQVKDGQLQEEVTSLAITYDYHTTNKMEYFVFAERFTDSFLSIQNRYEVGFGGRVGADFGYVGTRKVADAVQAVEDKMDEVKNLLAGAAKRGEVRDGLPDYSAFAKTMDNLDHISRDTYSRLFLGLAASVFSELERAEIEATSVPASGSAGTSDQVKIKVLLDTAQRYRLSIRPTIKFRPAAQVSIIVFPYFKLPLDGPHKVDTPSGRRLDYRRDILSEMTWSIKPDQTGLENVDVTVSYNHYFDNVPPALPQSVIDAAAANGRVFLATEAEHSHRYVALTLKLRW
jgi:hypothetical protein